MNRRGFLKSLGLGAVLAPAALAQAGETIRTHNVNTILRHPRPWKSALDSKWYGYDGAAQQWVEILPPEPGQPYQPKIGGKSCP